MKISLVLWSQKTSKGYPIRIIVSDKNKHQYFNTGVYIENKKFWNTISKEIRGSTLQSLELNQTIQNELQKVKNNYYVNPYGVVAYTKDYSNYLLSTKHFGNHNRYKVIETSLSNFIKDIYFKDDVLWSEVNTEFLKKWREYIESNRTIQSSTLRNYFKKFKTLFLRAKTEKKHNIDLSIFDIVKIKDNEVRHKALNKDQINKLFNPTDYKIISSKKIMNSILIFKFQYYTAMRIGDVLALKWSNIQNRSIVYKMRKTKQDHIIPITGPVKDILISLLPPMLKSFFKLNFEEPIDEIKYLAMFRPIRNKFVFPYLDDDTDLNSYKGYKAIQSKTSIVNSGLKQAGDVLGLKISSHVARHSIASAMIRSEKVNLLTIKQLLNHSSIDITQKYLMSLNKEEFESNYNDFVDSL
jgi:integrase